MNTKQLYRAVTRNKVTHDYFDGVYAKDTLEDIQSQPCLIIANTADSSHPGKHWVVFFFDKEKNHVEFFDSLGNDLTVYGKEFIDFVSRFSTSYKFTSTRTQPRKTSLCGVYCLYFTYWKCQNKSFDFIVKKLKKTKAKEVYRFVYKMFALCDAYNTQLLQCCTVR
jgi:uncharacterized membrane protein YwzB